MGMYPSTIDGFKQLVEYIQSTDAYRPPLLYAIGGRVYAGEMHASIRYPFVNGLGQNTGFAAILIRHFGIDPHGVQSVPLTVPEIDKLLPYFRPFAHDGKRHRNVDMLRAARGALAPVVTFIFDDTEPQGVDDATLKLYALSLRLYKPNALNVSRIFTKLPTMAWAGDTPMCEAEVDVALERAAFGRDTFCPHMVDKFPLYTHRINALTMGVRITDHHKVRLGAYMGAGTTLMPGASYINFNAGTEGPAMVEGRISSSSFVGAGSDVGGGASILGTLSGGNAVPISVGRNCLLEVNSALGIPLGDACIVAAETAVMASSVIRVHLEGHRLHGQVVKARELAGSHAVTFRRDSQSGELVAVRTPRNIEFAKRLDDGATILSADLHAG